MAEETKEFAEVKVTDQSVMQALLEADFMILGTKLVAEYYKNGELFPSDAYRRGRCKKHYGRRNAQ